MLYCFSYHYLYVYESTFVYILHIICSNKISLERVIVLENPFLLLAVNKIDLFYEYLEFVIVVICEREYNTSVIATRKMKYAQ